MGDISQPTAAGRPFVYHRRVLWGDCDPQNVIYTPRAFDYLMEALEAWSIEVLGLPWIEFRDAFGVGSPSVHTECDYLSVLRSGAEVALSVSVERLGKSSVTFAVIMADADTADTGGTEYMRFKHTTCFITVDDFKAAPVPATLREKILAYQTACGG